jgi:hypothetical protein
LPRTETFLISYVFVIDRNFAMISMLVALAVLLGTVLVLVSLCGVRAESPLVNTLATGAVGIGGGIGTLAMPVKPQEPK